MTKYSLKINTDFNEKEIANAVKIFNCDLPKEYIFTENNFENNKTQNNFISHTIINLNTENASVKFIGRYKAEKSLCDISCTINHNVRNTKSDINIKGIAKINGKMISRSKINVKENVGDVIGNENAKFIFVINQNEKGEILTGEIDAIPELNINSNDVSINHSLSISKIKEADI
jgi:hypothetical protein